MPAFVSVTISPEQLADLKATLAGVKNGAPKAITAAINRTLTTGRSRVVKRVTGIVNLKARDARDVIGTRKATYSTLEGSIRLSRKAIPLINYGARQTKKGVSVAVRKGEGRKVIPHTFLATMRSGHTGVFERKPGSKHVRRVNAKHPEGVWTQLGIRERYGPTLLGVFQGAPGVASEVIADLAEVLKKNLASQIDRLLGRKGPAVSVGGDEPGVGDDAGEDLATAAGETTPAGLPPTKGAGPARRKGDIHVKAHTRSDGRFVAAHVRRRG